VRFQLDEGEAAIAKAFAEKHRHKDKYKGAIGGGLSYVITGTSIGELLAIKCNCCDESALLNGGDL
jgi:hypothetical protein